MRVFIIYYDRRFDQCFHSYTLKEARQSRMDCGPIYYFLPKISSYKIFDIFEPLS